MEHYDDLNIIGWLMIVGVSVVLIYPACNDMVSMLEIVLILDFYIWAVRGITGHIDQKRQNALLEIMTKQCRSGEFIEKYRAVFDRNIYNEIEPVHALNLAHAYTNTGNTEKAMEMYKRAQDPERMDFGKYNFREITDALFYKAFYYNNIADTSLVSHNLKYAGIYINEFENNLDKLKKMQNKYRVNRKSKGLKINISRLNNSLELRKLHYEIESGEELDPEETKAKLNALSQEASSILIKVKIKFLLIKICELRGEYEEAEEHRTYVREFGGDFYGNDSIA